MITDLLFSIVLAAFVLLGLTRPYIALTGVVWVDTIMPQMISSSFLTDKPLSKICTLVFFISLLFNFRSLSIPKYKTPFIFLIFFMGWITLSTQYAHHPFMAWLKFDIVFKILFFCLFIPFILNTRQKIEVFIWVFISSVVFYTLIGGLKTLGGGGGYAMEIIQTRAINSGITETSTLSILAIAIIPILFFMYKHSLLIRLSPIMKIYIALAVFTAIAASIGTYARSGLVAFGFLVMISTLLSKYRIRIIVISGVLVLASLPFLSDSWINRMSTITQPGKESSALGRMVVWRWTLDYVKQYPWLGGGFYAYLDNAGKLHAYTEGSEEFEENPQGKAFHSVIFEVLGEHGYPGLILYFLFVLSCLLILLRNYLAEDADAWTKSLSLSLLLAACTYFVGGLFVAIAYMPWIYYILFIGVSMGNFPNNLEEEEEDNRDDSAFGTSSTHSDPLQTDGLLNGPNQKSLEYFQVKSFLECSALRNPS